MAQAQGKYKSLLLKAKPEAARPKRPNDVLETAAVAAAQKYSLVIKLGIQFWGSVL
jgi:hypothetical protein